MKRQLAALVVAPLLALSPALPAEAASPRNGSYTLTTDTIKTTVTVAMTGRRIDCIKIKTGAGHWRHVEVWMDGIKVINLRLPRYTTGGCYKGALVRTTRNTPIKIRVTEDMPGPFNFVANKTSRVR